MLKKGTVVVVFAVILTFSLPLMAQLDEEHASLGVKVGWTFLQDDPLKDTVENCWIIGADVIFWMDSGLGFGGDVKLSMKDKKNADIEPYNTDFDWVQTPFSLNVYYRLDSEDMDLKPYFGGGLTVVLFDATVNDYAMGELDTIRVDINEFAVGFNIVGGLQFDKFFLEGQFIQAKTEFGGLEVTNPFASVMDRDDSVNIGGFNFAVGYRF